MAECRVPSARTGIDSKNRLSIYDLHRDELAATFATGMVAPWVMRFSPDGRRIAIVDLTDCATIWPVPTTASLVLPLAPDDFERAWGEP